MFYFVKPLHVVLLVLDKSDPVSPLKCVTITPLSSFVITIHNSSMCFSFPWLLLAPMTVKDVLQSLVDDNMVDCEKVGTSNYFWAFPSKALHARKRKLEELQKQVSLKTKSGNIVCEQPIRAEEI